MSAKYYVGQRVMAAHAPGTIVAVHEGYYFYTGQDPYYEYEVQRDDGSIYKFPESALDTIKANEVKCECGAKFVHWATNEHARWCAAYQPNKEHKHE